MSDKWISVEDRLPDEPIADKDGWLEYASYSVYLDRTFGFKYGYWVYVGDGEWWREDTDDTTDSKHVTH